MKNAVHAWEIESLLDQAPDATQVLSLDCFDTLIWRNVNAPVDVFNDLSLSAESVYIRICAEQRARKALTLQTSKNEVDIHDIYRNMFGQADDARIEQCVEDELKAEARQCFAFNPVSKLIDDAKQRGLQVIIVSDTYLREPQLRALITAAAGQETADKIDRIFCSCEYGKSKAGGLFQPVLADLGISPKNIVHLGDNLTADHDAAQKLGINGVHFEQFDKDAEERLRLEAMASTLLENDTRRGAPAVQPHRAQISLHQSENSITRFGHDVLGPIMQGYAHWIAEESDKLKAETGKAPKLLFLLRDGYLPAKAFAAAYPDYADQIAMVELSRFTANAASFTNAKAIETFLVEQATNNKKDAYSKQRQAAYCKQMLFNSFETTKLSGIAKPDAFIREILKPKNSKKIIARSKKYGEGLFAHLRNEGVEDGDTVMFVDLGYNGSVQNVIEPVLNEAMDLKISGRYLLLRELILSGIDKTGMIDVRNYDNGALSALCESIAVMEQLCTLSQGSVLGYNEAGEPLRDTADIKGMQNETRDAAQAGCLSFMEQCGSGWATTPASWNSDSARRMAAAALSRLLFLPVDSEVEIFRNFTHDVNMGTKDMIKLIDPEAAAEGLRRRGLFYTKNITRMYLPGELKQQGITALLPTFAGRRFGLDLRQSDFQAEGISIPVTLANEAEHVQIDVSAYPTNEGYYQALIPVGSGQLNVAIMIGQICDWLQVEDVSFHEIDNFMAHKIDDDSLPAAPIFESMTENAPGLHRCATETAFIFVPPPTISTGNAMMLNFVFRPTILRQAAAAGLRKVA